MTGSITASYTLNNNNHDQSEMAATIFPRFLELPRELQIQVWEEAIKETIEDPYDDHEYLQENFGVHFSYTDKVLAKRRVSRNGEGYLVSLRPSITQPCFKTVMNTCHFSRLVACQWWRRMLEPCTPSNGYYREKQVREKEVVLKQVGEMIEDLDRKLAGGPPAQITQ